MTIPDHAKASFNKVLHAIDRSNLARVEYPDTPTPANPAASCLLAVTTGRISRLCCSFGLYQTEVVSPAEVWQSLFGGPSLLVLTGNMTLRCVGVMNDRRVELACFTHCMRAKLRSIDLFSAMIALKARHFIPASLEGQAVSSHLIERYRVIDVAGWS
jgi:hypothetical protein